MSYLYQESSIGERSRPGTSNDLIVCPPFHFLHRVARHGAQEENISSGDAGNIHFSACDGFTFIT